MPPLPPPLSRVHGVGGVNAVQQAVDAARPAVQRTAAAKFCDECVVGFVQRLVHELAGERDALCLQLGYALWAQAARGPTSAGAQCQILVWHFVSVSKRQPRVGAGSNAASRGPSKGVGIVPRHAYFPHGVGRSVQHAHLAVARAERPVEVPGSLLLKRSA